MRAASRPKSSSLAYWPCPFGRRRWGGAGAVRSTGSGAGGQAGGVGWLLAAAAGVAGGAGSTAPRGPAQPDAAGPACTPTAALPPCAPADPPSPCCPVPPPRSHRLVEAARQKLLHLRAAVLALVRAQPAGQVGGDEVAELLVAHGAARVAVDAEVLGGEGGGWVRWVGGAGWAWVEGAGGAGWAWVEGAGGAGWAWVEGAGV